MYCKINNLGEKVKKIGRNIRRKGGGDTEQCPNDKLRRRNTC